MRYVMPYSYGFATRVKSIGDKISFFIIFVLPEFFICHHHNQTGWGIWNFLLRFILGLSALYCLYEIGYLQNDTSTARREKNPTIRLSHNGNVWVCNHVFLLIAVRLIFAGAMLGTLAALGCSLFHFVVLLCLVMLAFGWHNAVRSRWNILSYALVCCFKYFALPTLFISPAYWPDAFSALFFSFVLPRSLEHASKKKYGFVHYQTYIGAPDRFRLRYYTGLLCACILLFCCGHRYTQLFALAIWFFSYRLALYLWLQKHPRDTA